jgi:vacuolar-type H+-ATPase subunit H
MTSSNGAQPASELTPEQLQLEIARTKSAITDDLRALSDRFRPDLLRESAREVMRDAREEATHLMRDAREEATHLVHEAKDAAIDSLVGAKDRAIESVQQRVSAIGAQTRHAGVLTLEFLSRNRVMFSLLSVGTGLLVYALRGHRLQQLRLPRVGSRRQLPGARADHSEPGYQFEHHTLDEPPLQPRYGERDGSDASSPFATRRASQRLPLARDHRGAVVAVTVLAGLGLGLLLPVGERPRRALARTGARVWEGARAAAKEGLSRVEQALAPSGQNAEQTPSRLGHTLGSSGNQGA